MASLNGLLVEIAAEVQEPLPPSAPLGEAGWDESYVFRPSPTFWRPLASLPASSFPPYDHGYHLQSPNRIVYASCNRQPEGLDAEKDLQGRRVWRHISRRKPQAFLWMGDNVYADHLQLPTAADSRNLLWRLTEGKEPIPPTGLLVAYNSQIANKEYIEFLAGVPVVAGTWDDHDMGEDNADKTYSYKDESKEAMLDFLGVDDSAAIRSLEWKGVYSSHYLNYGEDLRVKVIFLDLRFEKDSWWFMDHGDLLGEQQWNWLRQELQLSTADVNVVVSSLQVFANHRLVTETWSHFPWARERLFALLAGSGAKTPILLSGDTHYAEFAAVHCQRLPEALCLDEPVARSYMSLSHSRITGKLTPHQQLRRLSDSEEEGMVPQQPNNACDPSKQCCASPVTRSALFWWIPRNLPFFLLDLFRFATNPEAFAPRQLWRRQRAPAFYGSFPPPPFEPDKPQQSLLPEEDIHSTYLFDMTSSGLGHGVPESLCRSASALIELVVHFLTDVVPFSSSLNADITGPRLLYAERNFGELEFIENPLQLLLFPSGVNRSVSFVEQLDLLERLPEGDANSRDQLLRVRQKHVALEELHKQQISRSPLQAARSLTKELTAEFRRRLKVYKERRQGLVTQLRARPDVQLAVVERLNALSYSFEAYVQTMLGRNRILLERLLQLHSALLLTHMCEEEGAGTEGNTLTRRNRMLLGSCSLLAPWGNRISRDAPGSLVDAALWWLGDNLLNLSARREARASTLPMADAAALRLSSATDTLVRKSAGVRAATIASVALGRDRYEYSHSGFHWLGRIGPRRLSHRPRGTSRSQFTLRGVLAAASDRLVRQACFQLRSPRRQQQREGMQQLFERGVANQPADALDFAELDGDLEVVCSLVEVALTPERSSVPSTRSATRGKAANSGDGRAAVASSGVIIELLETKAWILARTFDVVSGRLVKEKLLSSFASEQQQRQPGFGQWACQGWKGPTENRLYLCHLCIFVATLIILAGVGLAVIVFCRKAIMLTVQTFVLWGRSCNRAFHPTSSLHSTANCQKQSDKIPQRHQPLVRKAVVVTGALLAVGLAAAVLLWMGGDRVRLGL